jgi:hypothetical protein
MSDQDKTPTDGRSTLELVLHKLGELSTDTKQALKESREANMTSLANNEMLRALVARTVTPPRLLRASLPYAAVLIALLALLRTW